LKTYIELLLQYCSIYNNNLHLLPKEDNTIRYIHDHPLIDLESYFLCDPSYKEIRDALLDLLNNKNMIKDKKNKKKTKDELILNLIYNKFITATHNANRYSWSISSPLTVQNIKNICGKELKILDMYCGKGYWSRVFKNIGFEVISVDNISEFNREDILIDDMIISNAYEYMKENSDKLSKDNYSLFISWPRCNIDLLSICSLWNGPYIFIIHEGVYGCTATLSEVFSKYIYDEDDNKYNEYSGIRYDTQDFKNMIGCAEIIKNKYELVNTIDIISRQCINDRLDVYKRKSNN
jgi:hypothetical protein